MKPATKVTIIMQIKFDKTQSAFRQINLIKAIIGRSGNQAMIAIPLKKQSKTIRYLLWLLTKLDESLIFDSALLNCAVSYRNSVRLCK